MNFNAEILCCDRCFFVVEIMPYNVKRLKKYHDVNYVARKSAGLATILLLNKKPCKHLERRSMY